MPRKSKSNVFNRYIMHTDAPDVRKDNRGKYEAEGEEWEKHTRHPEGVTEHIHEYGSSLYETNARTRREAINKFESVSKRKEQEAGDWLERQGDTIYRNPKFAFAKENRGKVKPTVVQGGKTGKTDDSP